jgi:hypothetical protein
MMWYFSSVPRVWLAVCIYINLDDTNIIIIITRHMIIIREETLLLQLWCTGTGPSRRSLRFNASEEYVMDPSLFVCLWQLLSHCLYSDFHHMLQKLPSFTLWQERHEIQLLRLILLLNLLFHWLFFWHNRPWFWRIEHIVYSKEYIFPHLLLHKDKV